MINLPVIIGTGSWNVSSIRLNFNQILTPDTFPWDNNIIACIDKPNMLMTCLNTWLIRLNATNWQLQLTAFDSLSVRSFNFRSQSWKKNLQEGIPTSKSRQASIACLKKILHWFALWSVFFPVIIYDQYIFSTYCTRVLTPTHDIFS